MVEKRASGRRMRRTHNAAFMARVALAALREDNQLSAAQEVRGGQRAALSMASTPVHCGRIVIKSTAQIGGPEFVRRYAAAVWLSAGLSLVVAALLHSDSQPSEKW